MGTDLPDPPQTQLETDLPARCTNCGAMVSGSYCSSCGQAVKYQLHSFWELVREATEVITHADSRLWRTLRALLFQPGFLSQQFLAGRRASYLSPFRLYFVLSVLFFLMVSITHTPPSPSAMAPASVATAPAPGPKSACEAAVGHSLIPGADKLRQPFVAACLKSQADNGRELREIFISNLGRAMFVLLPLIAAFMKLLYWRPARSYVTHLMLLLHFHAFAFLLFAAMLAAQRWVHADTLRGVALIGIIGWVPYYLYRSMRRVYAETWLRTLLKCTALSLTYIACALCMVLVAGLYSAESL